ncbi:MAG TPA: TerB family tellurite resistance protein [Hyphomicrobiaceae bacterium]|jgi:DnaJ like chaperone protein|nr:TerB family tellurite resistance protein [Hyphomicrobiaceae bacterium]
MTVWQKISGLASAVGDAGGGFLGELARVFGLDRSVEPQNDIAFTIAVIALSAKMARVDGVVSPLEMQAFRQVFQTRPEEERNVKRVFNLAQQDVAGYETYADEIARLLKDNKKLLQDVLEGLMYVAAVDGALHPDEDAFLAEVARRFGFSPSEFQFFRARFVVDHGNPYDALRLTPQATDEEIKRQYRKLVADNHPDKLMGRGVPAEFVEIATRKLAAINAAYDVIAKERGL